MRFNRVLDLTPSLLFFVVGTPAPQGSKRHVGRGILVESSKTLAPWRDSVAYAARHALDAGGPSFPTGPVSVYLTFALKRPKSAPKTRTHPDGRPDVDKLARGVLDALDTAGVYGDDSQVVTLTAWKRYAGENEPTGVSVSVCAAPDLSTPPATADLSATGQVSGRMGGGL